MFQYSYWFLWWQCLVRHFRTSFFEERYQLRMARVLLSFIERTQSSTSMTSVYRKNSELLFIFTLFLPESCKSITSVYRKNSELHKYDFCLKKNSDTFVSFLLCFTFHIFHFSLRFKFKDPATSNFIIRELSISSTSEIRFCWRKLKYIFFACGFFNF